MIHHYRGCGRCWLCGMGYTQMCREAEVMGTAIDGGHAPFMVVAASTLVELPDGAVVCRRRGDRLWHRDGVRGVEAPGRAGP